MPEHAPEVERTVVAKNLQRVFLKLRIGRITIIGKSEQIFPFSKVHHTGDGAEKPQNRNRRQDATVPRHQLKPFEYPRSSASGLVGGDGKMPSQGCPQDEQRGANTQRRADRGSRIEGQPRQDGEP